MNLERASVRCYIRLLKAPLGFERPNFMRHAVYLLGTLSLALGLLGGCATSPSGGIDSAAPGTASAGEASGESPAPALESPKQEASGPVGSVRRVRSREENSTASEERLSEAHALFANAVVLEMDGETEAANKAYIEAAEKDPGSEWLTLEVSRRLLQQRKYEEALALLQRAAVRPDVSGPVLARLGLVYSQLGKSDLAMKYSRAAIHRNPNDLAAYTGLFLNYMQSQKPQEALAVLDEAARVPKPTAPFLIGLSELYANYVAQNPSDRDAIKGKALPLLERARKLPLRDAELKLKLADGMSAFGNSEAATQLYHELLTEAFEDPALRETVHTKLANIYLRASDRKRAQEQLEALLKSDPTNPQPYYFLGQLAADDKKLEPAAEYFSKAIILRADFEPAYYELANAQLALDKPKEALATLEKARQKFAGNFFMEFGSAIACVRLKEYDRALQYFTAAEVVTKTSNPERLNHFFYFQLGVAYEQKGDYAEAARAFEKCLELSPDFDEAMNYLGYMWADRGENLDKALALLEKAVKKEPENAAYLDSLGWVYFRLKRLPEALEYISKAIKLSDEPDATLNDHLGDVYHAMGNDEKAGEAWTKSLEIEPKNEVRAKMESLKKSGNAPGNGTGAGTQERNQPPKP
jgi:tetratricopeptide (TPR) repeat protein